MASRTDWGNAWFRIFKSPPASSTACSQGRTAPGTPSHIVPCRLRASSGSTRQLPAPIGSLVGSFGTHLRAPTGGPTHGFVSTSSFVPDIGSIDHVIPSFAYSAGIGGSPSLRGLYGLKDCTSPFALAKIAASIPSASPPAAAGSKLGSDSSPGSNVPSNPIAAASCIRTRRSHQLFVCVVIIRLVSSISANLFHSGDCIRKSYCASVSCTLTSTGSVHVTPSSLFCCIIRIRSVFGLSSFSTSSCRVSCDGSGISPVNTFCAIT